MHSASPLHLHCMERILVWYRNDLRIDDHAPLSQACEGSHALGVVCVSPEDYSPTALGFAKAGPFRARFRLESIAALQLSLIHI